MITQLSSVKLDIKILKKSAIVHTKIFVVWKIWHLC